MRRPARPTVLLLAVLAAAAAVGVWILYPQAVSVQAYYTTSLAGSSVAIEVDGGPVGAFVIPRTPADNTSCILLVGCPVHLGSLWLLRGVHEVRVVVDNETVLEHLFAVSGRSYVWFVVYWDRHASFGIGETPPMWL